MTPQPGDSLLLIRGDEETSALVAEYALCDSDINGEPVPWVVVASQGRVLLFPNRAAGSAYAALYEGLDTYPPIYAVKA